MQITSPSIPSPVPPSDRLLEALAAHYMAMPPVAAMQPSVLDWQDGCLRMHAPLDANVNDKGCAFGGSLSSLMTIAGWGLAFLKLAEAGLEADIYVADSRVRYLKPVYEDLLVEVRLDTAGEGGADAIDLPGALRGAADTVGPINPMLTSYFLSATTIVPHAGGGMALWREKLFAQMHLNASGAAGFLNLPSNAVVELGSKVEI